MEDNPDSLVNQEVLTPGQLFLMFLKVSACCHCGPLRHWCGWMPFYCMVIIPSVSILRPLFFV